MVTGAKGKNRIFIYIIFMIFLISFAERKLVKCKRFLNYL